MCDTSIVRSSLCYDVKQCYWYHMVHNVINLTHSFLLYFHKNVMTLTHSLRHLDIL
jgi:hypothetical protein